MKRFAFLIAVALLIGLLVPEGRALASPPVPHLNWGSQLNASQCPGGQLVINVVQDVVNDADSGVAGNAWAFDHYTRQIQVWQVSSDTFCALVQYEGGFVTKAGPSPAGTGTIAAGIAGTLQGGYRSTVFTGTLNSTPAYPTGGNIGTFDYKCDASFNCPGRVDWVSAYFGSSSGFDLAWWGWIYHGGNNSTWVNASTGNQGDITN